MRKLYTVSIITGILILGTLGFSQNVYAPITTFTDKATFLSSTGASSATGALPDLGKVGLVSQKIGSVTFTTASGDLFVGASGVGVPNNDWTTLTSGNDIAISNTEDFDVEFDSPVFAAGFDIIEPSCSKKAGETPCANGDIGANFSPVIDSTFTVTLKLGGSFVDSFNFNAPDDVVAFIGVTSTSPFDKLEIREIVGNPDNEYFGEFYTSSAIPVQVDIKPGSDPSSVSCKNLRGNVPVAIFTDDNFDATTIDIELVSLNLVGIDPIPVEEIHGKLHTEDVDSDGDIDAVLHLDKEGVCEATSVAPLKQSVDVELSGKTTDGTEFKGTGDIRIVNR